MKKQLPPPTPPDTGGEPNARNRFNLTMQHILPLCKGELEWVVAAPAPCGRNHKSKIINHKS